jgi:hypothetical protein
VFRVSTYYGGTLGGSDDTTCIQNTLDACHDAGGGVVVLPPNAPAARWKAEQLVIPDGVHFRGAGWHSYALDDYSGGTKLQQLTGVNDDFIVFEQAGVSQHIVACGVSDMALRGAIGSSSGHAISVQNAGGTELGVQDLTTFERVASVGFFGSTIKVTKSAPFSASDIHGIGNGGYVVEVVDGGAITSVLLKNISGDGNLGYGAGLSGATVYLGNIDNPYTPVVSIFGVKSEYRARESYWPNGNGTSWGNFNAVIIEDCVCPISISGVTHTGYHSTTKPGNAVQILGSVPDLAWQSVDVDLQTGQTVGDDPVAVYDDVNSRSYNTPHGVLGPTDFSLNDVTIDQIKGANGTTVVEIQGNTNGANYFYFGNWGSGGSPYAGVGGADANIDYPISTAGTGRLKENNNIVGSWVAVPGTATSTGKQGQMAADSSWLYICTATNVWRRVAIASW